MTDQDDERKLGRYILAMAVIAINILMIFDFHRVSPTPFLGGLLNMKLLLIAVPFTALYNWIIEYFKDAAAFKVLVSFVFAVFSVQHLNADLDFAAPQSAAFAVTEKRLGAGRRGSYFGSPLATLEINHPDARRGTDGVYLDKAQYESIEPGSSWVEVEWHRGAFGVPWFPRNKARLQ